MIGFTEPDPLPQVSSLANPRLALEQAVREALLRPPCGVAFSGGRDSSLILAVAVAVARADDLPLPVPITFRFGKAPDSDETDWQELVVRHLDLDDWEKIELTDEVDLIGDFGQHTLRLFGPDCPPQLHFLLPMVDRLRGGTLLTGEYGDDLFDERRIALARDGWRQFRRRRRPKSLVSIGFNLAPHQLRRTIMPRRAAQTWAGTYPWMHPDAEAELIRLSTLDDADEPLRWADWIDWLRGLRAMTYHIPFQRALGSEVQVVEIDPLWDDRFLTEAQSAVGGFGWIDRTSAFRALAEDLLPPTVLERTSKAAFQDAFVGEHSRDFVRSWTGDGVDADTVDVESLRACWSQDFVDARTYGLLRSAWWSSQHKQRTTWSR